MEASAHAATEPCAMCEVPVVLPAHVTAAIDQIRERAAGQPDLAGRIAAILPLVLCPEHQAKRQAYRDAMHAYAAGANVDPDLFAEAVGNVGFMLELHEHRAAKAGARNQLNLSGLAGGMVDAYVQALTHARHHGHDWAKHAYKPSPGLRTTKAPATNVLAGAMASTEPTKPPPRWQGAATLQRAWKGTLDGYNIETRRPPRGGLTVVTSQALEPLAVAHPIVVEPDQVMALPSSMDDGSAYEYGHQLRLPFPSVWLSMTGRQDGYCPTWALSRQQLQGRLSPLQQERLDRHNRDPKLMCPGALLFDGGYYAEAGCLVVVPYVPAIVDQVPGPGFDIGPASAANRGMLAPVGCVLFHTEPVVDTGDAWRMTYPGLHQFAAFACVEADGAHYGATIPAVTTAGELAADDATDEETIAASICWLLTKVVLEVMAMLDSANVTIEPAALEKRDIKRAHKRGWKVASEVVIRRRLRPRSQVSTGDGAGRDYSHQWEVEGHFNHVRRGVHVRCPSCLGEGSNTGWWMGDYMHPDVGDGEAPRGAVFEKRTCQGCAGTGLDPGKVRPCFRTDERGQRTCPDGCRKEWVPPYVAGPEGTPLVKKTRRLPAGDSGQGA